MIEYYIRSTKYNIQERQTKKHGKVYDVVFRVVTLDGIEKQKKLSGYTTKALAKQGYADFVTTKCELVKNNPIKKKKTDREVPTVGDLIRQYLASLPNQNKDSSIYDKQNIYRLFIFPKYENEKITIFTKDELFRWQDELWSTKNPRTNNYYSYKYLSKIRGHLSAFLAWVESRYGYKSYIGEVKMPKRRAPKTQMKIWTQEEFDRFAENISDPKWHCLFTLLFYTGRRIGEIIALSPNDIKGDTIVFDKSVTRKTIDESTYKLTSTKEEKVQQIPICDIVKKELKSFHGDTPFFFGGSKPISDNTIRRKFDKYTQIAGLERIRVHDLRHSFVSMLIHLGANFNVIADLIGDTVEQVIKTYGHMYVSDKMTVISMIK